MPTNLNDSPPQPLWPLVDEAHPGLGRNSGWLDQQRRDSGGLPDSSEDAPFRDDNPIRIVPQKR